MIKRKYFILITSFLLVQLLGCANNGVQPNETGLKSEKRTEIEKELLYWKDVNAGKLEVDVVATLDLSVGEKSAIAEISGNEAYSMAQIAVDQSGNIFIARRQERTIAVYDKTGKLMRSFKLASITPEEMAVNRRGDRIFIIDRAGKLLQVVNENGDKLHAEKLPQDMIDDENIFRNHIFIVDNDAIAIEGGFVFNLRDKKWRKTEYFKLHGLDNNYYDYNAEEYGSGSIIKWSKPYSNKEAILFGDMSPIDVLGIDGKGYFYERYFIGEEVYSRRPAWHLVMVYNPYKRTGVNVKLPFGDTCIAYDDSIYVVPSITKEYRPTKLVIYRFSFLTSFNMNELDPQSDRHKNSD